MSAKRQSILQAATILFAEIGYKETSIAEVARITHSAEGTVFYHFQTKERLFLAILQEVKEGILAEFEDYFSKRDFGSGLEMMEGVVGFFLYLAGHHEPWFRLLQRHYPYEFARNNDESRRHLEDIYNTLVDLFETAIRRGKEDGSIHDLASRKTALVLFSMVNGLLWFKFQGLYDPATLYEELLANCKRILSPYPD
jgi:AcrR family transcriptional regulator